MTDPTFETREALEEWVHNQRAIENSSGFAGWRALGTHKTFGELNETRIRRVTAAHQHLMETPDVDAQ